MIAADLARWAVALVFAAIGIASLRFAWRELFRPVHPFTKGD